MEFAIFFNRIKDMLKVIEQGLKKQHVEICAIADIQFSFSLFYAIF